MYKSMEAVRVAMVIAALTLVAAGPSAAAVTNVGPGGFEIKQVVHISAPADRVYAALIQPARWWDSDHTFSGNASNMTMDAKAGGCFCEALPKGGSVRHMTVVEAAPGEELSLRGALGPFMTRGVDGALTFSIKPAGDGVDLTMTNTLGGYMSEGFAIWAPRADGMLTSQMTRLKRYLETGKPDA